MTTAGLASWYRSANGRDGRFPDDEADEVDTDVTDDDDDEGRPGGRPPPGSRSGRAGGTTPMPALINITMVARCSYARLYERDIGGRTAGKRTGGAVRAVSRVTAAQQSQRSRDSWSGEQAAIYCRISHIKDKDQTSVERQERICREIVSRLGLALSPGRVFIDPNRSAWKRNRNRPGWDTLLEAARNKQIRHIVVYHPDRLMRQPWDLEELLKIADDHGIILHGKSGNRDLSDPDDRHYLRGEVAHACRSTWVTRTLRAGAGRPGCTPTASSTGASPG